MASDPRRAARVSVAAAIVSVIAAAASIGPAALRRARTAMPEPSSAPTVRVGCLGDSITEDGYPQALVARLGPRFRVANEGVSGETTAQLLSRWRFGIRDARFDVLVVLGGVNDLRFGSGSGSVAIANLRTLYDEARGSGTRLVAVPVLPFRGAERWTEALERERALVNQFVLGYCATHREVTCVDPEPAMGDGTGRLREDLHAGDGVHLSAKGAAVLAALVGAAVAGEPAARARPGPR